MNELPATTLYKVGQLAKHAFFCGAGYESPGQRITEEDQARFTAFTEKPEFGVLCSRIAGAIEKEFCAPVTPKDDFTT